MKSKGVTPKKRDKPTGFFHLPVEIRMEIYRLCVPNGYVFDVREKPTFADYRNKPRTRDALLHWTAMDWIDSLHFRGMIEASSDESSSAWSGPEYAYASSEGDQSVSEDSEAEDSSAEESQEDTDEALGEGSEDDRSTDWGSDSGSSQEFPSGGAMHLFGPSPFERSENIAFYGTAADQLFYYLGFEDEDGSEEGDSYGEADIYDYDHGSVSDSDSDSKSDSEGESESESGSESDSESESHGTSSAEADSSLLDHIKGIPMDKWRDITSLSPNWVPTICGLLLASRQIREEVLDVLYGENVFRVAVGKRSSERAVRIGFSQSKLQRIRHVMFIYKQFSNCPGTVPEFSIDRRLWDDILPNLTTLHFVAEQPTGDLENHAGDCLRTVADQMRVWLQELPPTLAYLGRTLSPSALFLVDVDGTKVTSGLIDASLGRKWEHVRTTTGDILFRRPSTYRRHHVLDQTFDDAPSYCSCDDSSSG
ncbi:hypothetical protein BR93DRAFT_956110 [Coniochaeta sp. PMI_546]|nr:hypothetical protein BR93DRAFT_956110 [Coniochaeta sp. PMI_546]